ncbi:MAG: ABC transporter substrate-binding protein [Rectinemataceae bacterium]
MKRKGLLGSILALATILSLGAAPASKPIVIGVLGAMSGSSASLGKAQQQGVELAVDEINASGGVLGREVKAVYRDDEADPTKSLTAAQELIDREGINFLVGTTNSTPGATVIPFLQDNKIVSITSIATSTTIIDAAKYPYAFRVFIPNGLQANALVLNAKRRGYKKIALVADTSALGVDGMTGMVKYCAQYGVTPVAQVTYQSDDPDMSPVAESLKHAGADCALFWTLGADGAKIVKSLERIGYIYKLHIYGYTGIGMTNFKELAGPGASRCASLGVKDWAVANANSTLKGRFLDLYNKIVAKYGAYGPGKRDTNPYHVAAAYDCVMLLKWAIVTAGSTDPDAVKVAIETQGSKYQGYFGSSYKFSATDHDGFRPEDCVPVDIADKVNGDLQILR